MPNPRDYPVRPIPAVGVVVHQADRVLIVQRGNAPGRGEWGLPGGVLELGETWREAATREVREECGIEIALGQVIDVVDIILRDDDHRVQYDYAVVDFSAMYVSGELRVATDALDARWISSAELGKFPMSRLVREVMRKSFRLLQVPRAE
jgi:8-oxo-dGTP diphosphatase